MSVINGTIVGIQALSANPAGSGNTRRAYLITADFAAYTGASDTATITGVGAAIAAQVRNGKTITLRGGISAHSGLDTNAQQVHFTGASVTAATLSTDDLTGQLSTSATTATEITTSTACTGVGVIAIVDES